MKKYAMMLMNPRFAPDQHRAHFPVEGVDNQIVTVRNLDEALAQLERFIADGVGVLELCGAFDGAPYEALVTASRGRLSIGRVTYAPDQEAAMNAYWAN
ncbi:MAG: DUF6506 family protein [Peptococcaceae bacterium]|nr:DUF6506 family protein [Peptococcaceae bacterium]